MATTGTMLSRSRRGSGCPRLKAAPHTTWTSASAVLSGKTCKPWPATSCPADQAYIQSSLNASGGERSKMTSRSSPVADIGQIAATGHSSRDGKRPARRATDARASGLTFLREQCVGLTELVDVKVLHVAEGW